MKETVIDTTIAKILELNIVCETKLYTPFEEFTIFSPLAGLSTFGMDIETEESLTNREYVKDQSNDGRSRDVNILTYKGVPFAIYQYIGKGNIENEKIFNIEVYSQFIRDYINEYLQKQKVQFVDSTSEYQVENYDMAYFTIEDNTIISRNEERC